MRFCQPDLDGLYLGGGFPELYAHAIAENHRMRTELHELAARGRPINAECGGYMALGRTLTTFEGETLNMFGVLPVDSRMQRETLTIGHRDVEALRPSPLMPAGARVRGHEFHWSLADAPQEPVAAYRIIGADRLEGFCDGNTLASYVHLNMAGAPDIAKRFVASCASHRQGTGWSFMTLDHPNARQLTTLVVNISRLDERAMDACRLRQDQLTKPPGNLGRLERLATQLAGITGSARPRLPRKAVIVMAADHGVTCEGVSAYPPEVTAQMVMNFARGGAAINVLARQADARVVVVDVGVASEFSPSLPIVHRKIGFGTLNLAETAPMSREEALAAIEVGADVLASEAERGLDVVCLGEMGIGNTTASSAVVAAITGLPVSEVTGRGTGIDDATWTRKVRVIERALELHQPDRKLPLDVLAKVGGFEIAGLVGVVLAAASRHIAIVVDGFIASAAALVAVEVCPAVRSFMIAAHRSVELGHRAVLERLYLEPLVALDLRLGEGSGAALVLPTIDAAAALLDEMATFDEAGVAGSKAVAASE